MSIFKKLDIDIGDFDENHPVFKKIADAFSEKDDQISGLKKQVRRARARYTYAEESLNKLFDCYLKIGSNEGIEYSIPHRLYRLGEFTFKKHRFCFIRAKEYGEKDGFSIKVNDVDIGDSKNKTTYLSLDDKFYLYDENGEFSGNYTFEIQNLIENKIDPDDIPEIIYNEDHEFDEEDESKPRPVVKGFTLDLDDD